MTTSHHSQAQQRVLSFLDTEVAKYLVPDLDRLTNEIRPRGSEGLQGCTVALALMVFAVADYFGFLMRDDEPQPKKDETKKNIAWLLKSSGYFPQNYQHDAEVLVLLFRHGMAHQCFPKACGVAKATQQRPLFFNAGGNLNLNVDVLSKDTAAFFAKLRAVIHNDQNPQLADRMNVRLNQLNRDDHKALQQIQKRFPELFKN